MKMPKLKPSTIDQMKKLYAKREVSSTMQRQGTNWTRRLP